MIAKLFSFITNTVYIISLIIFTITCIVALLISYKKPLNKEKYSYNTMSDNINYTNILNSKYLIDIKFSNTSCQNGYKQHTIGIWSGFKKDGCFCNIKVCSLSITLIILTIRTYYA